MAETTVIFNSNLDEVLELLQPAKAKTLAEIGVVVQASAAENSPVRTGNLRRSWTVEVDEASSCVSIGVPKEELEGNYAVYVENGTSKQKAHHMLRNAVEQNKNQFPGIAETEFKNA
jgi:HK97 gp10 family phage protein